MPSHTESWGNFPAVTVRNYCSRAGTERYGRTRYIKWLVRQARKRGVGLRVSDVFGRQSIVFHSAKG